MGFILEKLNNSNDSWNVSTLKEHTEDLLSEMDKRNEQRFTASEKAINAALAAADRAVMKAETAAEKRFESVNEFRGTLSDQQRSLMPRSEADVEFRAMRQIIDDLKTRMDKNEGKSKGFETSWLIFIGLGGLILTLLGLIAVIYIKK